MHIQRRYSLLGIALLVLACLLIVFQPVRLAPRPQDFHIRVEFNKALDDIVPKEAKSGDISNYVRDTVFKDYEDVEEAVRVGDAGLILTCRKATVTEANQLLSDAVSVLTKKIAKPREAVITDLKKLGDAPAKVMGWGKFGLAFYKPYPHVRLGLDLQGGSHIVLQIRRALFEYKFEKPIGETDPARAAFLENLRVALEKAGIAEAEVKVKTAQPNTLQIHTQPANQKEFNQQKDRIVSLLRQQGGAAKLGKVEQTRTPQFYDVRPHTLNQTKDIIERRVNGLGVSEPNVHTVLPDRINVDLPGVKNLEEAKQAIGETAQLRFHLLPERFQPETKTRKTLEGREVEYVTFKDGGKDVPTDYVFEKSAEEFRDYVITGDGLEPNVSASLGSQDDPSEPAVHLNLRPSATRKFETMTSKYNPTATGGKNWHIAIFLDRECISAPVIRTAIAGGGVEISGGFASLEEANTLAALLNAGALPAPVDIVEERTISPTLGADSVRKSLYAGLVGLIMIVIFMLAWYRLPGALANVAVGIYCILNLAIIVLSGTTLTLPGIAGFILALGMSLDTNVLIFERLKEELATDKSFKSALQAAFHRAWTAILDSHITTITAAVVLYVYGTSSIKGFGLTLIFGVLSSLFTANTVTRILMNAVADTKLANNRDLWIPLRALWGGFGRYGVAGKPSEQPQIDLVGRRNLWFAISMGTIVLGVVACAWNYSDPSRRSLINLGIDFTGGAMFQYQIPKTVLQGKSAPQFLGEVRTALESEPTLKRKVGNPQLADENILLVRTQADTQSQKRDQEKVITDVLQKKYPGTSKALRSEMVGPVIGRELIKRAILAVIFGCGLILLFIWVRYNVQQDGIRYAVAGIVALLHDVLVMVGVFALAGRISPSIEADSAFVAALLTVVGYSINDSVVIFDRIRENIKLRRRDPFDTIVNDSLWETMTRSINTGLTVMFTLWALFLFGGASIHSFMLAMIIGITSGAYSSVFNASQILVAWRKWDEKKKQAAAPTRRTSAEPEPQKPAPRSESAPTTRPAEPTKAVSAPVAAVSSPTTSTEDDDEEEEIISIGTDDKKSQRKAGKRGKRKRRF
jgi:SecD/SecF fusion protein